MNPFTSPAAARRYAAARPAFHGTLNGHLRAACGIERRVPAALDVGCGTGQSSVALAELADRVLALDVSAAMLSAATPHPQVTYLLSPAEALPVETASVNLVTVGLALHWFDQPAFFTEAARVLVPGGHLVAYNDFFTGNLADSDALAAFNDSYLARYPSPPRNLRPVAPGFISSLGLMELPVHRYTRPQTFSADDFVDYLLTQSNTLAAIDAGREAPESLRAALLTDLGPIFSTAHNRTFVFGGEVRVWGRC